MKTLSVGLEKRSVTRANFRMAVVLSRSGAGAHGQEPTTSAVWITGLERALRIHQCGVRSLGAMVMV